MAKLIVKSPYIKCAGGGDAAGAGGYLHYIGTREHVQKLADDRPPTRKQEQLIVKLTKDFVGVKELEEYGDYEQRKTKATASALITMALEENWWLVSQMDGYLKYIATRPRAERLSTHGLFGDEDDIHLKEAMDELNSYTGNVWTHIISLRREDAARLGYDNAGAWRNLIRAHRNDIAAAMKIPPKDFCWYAAYHDEGEHPHIHMMAWSVKPGQAYLDRDGIRKIKSTLTNDIFNDLQQFYARIKKSGRKRFTDLYGEGLSDRMVRMCHATCRSALEKAMQEGLIRTNPAIGCKLPPKKAREMQVLDREELQRFLIQAKEEGYYELFLLDLATGLRRGELMALQWDDLDFKTGALNVNKQIYDVQGELQLSTPKTKTSIRKLTLPPAVVAVLREYRETVDSRWMFPSPVKEDCPMTPCAVRKRLQLILEHAGCKHVRFHDLRHIFATLSLQNGMDVKTLSAMLGHVSAATTLDIYTHITDDMRHSAAMNIDRGIGKAEPPQDDPEAAHNKPKAARITDFKPYVGSKRKPGTGCISEINDHLFEGRYSPMWPDGKKHARNVYAKTREECEEKLKVLIVEMKREIAEAKAVAR